ncbi:hypothetical protein KPH14_007477 [Odynerus spinipes]|uniref:PDZ domain-containing protein n=1 Tax=Odynerus spinipes TaxID=1348599 RepID=A0AAD9RAG8_9HYME|nr:hypothetical protein KPH14_007477 [Odynerus spinipes]
MSKKALAPRLSRNSFLFDPVDFVFARIVRSIMTSDIKLSRSGDQPWGFRLSGGADFSFPLTVVRVTMGGLAHKAGLQAGDVVIGLNGEPLQQLTHGEAHNRLVNAGNDLELTVVRDLIHKVAK